MPQACILYAGHEFADSARAVKQYLQGKGFSVHSTSFSYDAISTMPAAPAPCEVSIWLSHGGWDGPMMFQEPAEGAFAMMGGYDDMGDGSGNTTMSQVDPGTPQAWAKLKAWVTKNIKADGLLVSHACHSAGSNRWESTDGALAERWVHQVARDMNIYAVGVEGSTSSANRYDAVALARFALEGHRWKQASRAYRPGGQRASSWSGWLSR